MIDRTGRPVPVTRAGKPIDARQPRLRSVADALAMPGRAARERG